MSSILQQLTKNLDKEEEILSPHIKKASVVALFRLSKPAPTLQEKLQLLFIKRAESPKDIHSGQIAFPGGKVDKGENSKQAAIRETFEEIGIDLENENFSYLGHTPHIDVYKHFRKIKLFVCVHCEKNLVFLMKVIEDDSKFKLNSREVQDFYWQDFDDFCIRLNE